MVVHFAISDIDMKPISIIFLAIVLSAFLESGGLYAEVTAVESKNKTSADIPLKFDLEKTEWTPTVKKLQIWGTVRNTGKKTYPFVTVIVAAYDAAGKFLGRDTLYSEPSMIKPAQVGYVNSFLNTGEQIPAKLEYTVSGKN